MSNCIDMTLRALWARRVMSIQWMILTNHVYTNTILDWIANIKVNTID